MKKFITCSIFFSLFIFAGCSSKSSETNSASSNTVTANSSVASATNNAQSNPSSSITSSGPTQVVQNVDPNAFNAKPESNVKIVTVDPKQDKNTSGIYGRPAPDKSTFKTTMDAKGIATETRTFIDNPYLIKVERISTIPNKKIKIYLKNGKVVEVGEDKLPTFAVTAPGTILEAAGVDLKKLAEQNQTATDNPGKKQ
ncbi:MAG: hypothetical protein LUM44_13705 [Pyrinomonadaceae bacterium]|nr:hypothetical protein [Pyrinomonadaceae bacterium]